MSISEVPGQLRRRILSFVGSWWVEKPLERFWLRAEPCAALCLLTASLAEGRRSHQGFPGIGPAIGMGVVVVVVLQELVQSLFKVGCRTEIATFEKATLQHTKPQCHLVQPGTVNRREMEYVSVRGIGQKRSTLSAVLQIF